MATLTVTSTADSGAGSLRQAIADAASGDTIVFDSTTFPAQTETVIYLSLQLSMPARSLAIDGGETWTDENGVLKTRVVLDAQNASRCLVYQVNASLSLYGLTFKNGDIDNGGAIFLGATNAANVCDINNCVFSDCEVTNNGGALYLQSNASYTLTNCFFNTCVATRSGGAIYSIGSVVAVFNNCNIKTCNANNGGGIDLQGTTTTTVNNCIFDGCGATNNGGAVFSDISAVCVLNNCEVKNCSATISGGAFALTRSSITTIKNCTVNNCTAGNVGSCFYTINAAAVTINGGAFVSSAERSIYISATGGTATFNGVLSLGDIAFASNALVVISGNVVVNTLRISAGATITFDGTDRVLAATTTANIGSATFTAAENSNGFLAVPVNTNISSATFTGVVACNYGAGITAFRYRYPNVIYTATNISVPALLQKSDSGSQPWTSVALISESPYNYDQSTPTTFRLFDGATFLYYAFSGIGKHFETTAKFPIGYLVIKNTIGYLN